MLEEFYTEHLEKLEGLVERTEIILSGESQYDLINLFAYRNRLKGLVAECDVEIEKRVDSE